MASTITGTATSWTITSVDGRASGAAKNKASATLQIDGTVVIESDGGETLWAGDIMGLAGLAGANPAARFADLLNSFLTGSLPAPINSIAAARFGVDPSSNPGPLINGLLFDPTTTTAGTWIIPMTSTPTGLGIGDNFEDDADGYFTLTNPTSVTINVSGKYHISAAWFVLTSDPLDPVSLQVLKNGDAMFTAPPAFGDFSSGSSTGTTPISALYTRAYSMLGSMDCALTAGDVISCKLYAEGGSGGDTAEITLTSALCIHLLGGTQAAAGTVGITAVNNQPSGDEVLVNNPGAGPVIGVKRLTAGSDIGLTSDADSVTINFTGSLAGTTVDNAVTTGEVLVTGAAPAYTVKRLKTGNYASLTSDATSVTIGTNLDNGFTVSNPTNATFTTSFVTVIFGAFSRNSGVLTYNSGTGQIVQDVRNRVIHFDFSIQNLTPSTGVVEIQLDLDGAGDGFRKRYPAGWTGNYEMSITVRVFNYPSPANPRMRIKSTVADGTYGQASSGLTWFSAQLLA
jgi:hypothetical protein